MVLQVSKNKEQRLRFGFVRHQNAKMDGVEVLAVKKSNPKFMVMISGHIWKRQLTRCVWERLIIFKTTRFKPIVEYGSQC
jgi:hypothetical protein